MMKTIHVRVNREDIASGAEGASGLSPVAIALNRKLLPPYRSYVNKQSITVTAGNSPIATISPPPPQVLKLLHDFHSGRSTRTIEFTIQLPKEVLR
jgi:hypothetical protein